MLFTDPCRRRVQMKQVISFATHKTVINSRRCCTNSFEAKYSPAIFPHFRLVFFVTRPVCNGLNSAALHAGTRTSARGNFVHCARQGKSSGAFISCARFKQNMETKCLSPARVFDKTKERIENRENEEVILCARNLTCCLNIRFYFLTMFPPGLRTYIT